MNIGKLQQIYIVNNRLHQIKLDNNLSSSAKDYDYSNDIMQNDKR